MFLGDGNKCAAWCELVPNRIVDESIGTKCEKYMKDILVETLDILNDGGVEKVKMCCAYHVTELHI